MLWSLQTFGSWHDCGCGWMVDSRSRTIRALDSLVKRGLVKRQEQKLKSYLKRTWVIRTAGKKAFEKAHAAVKGRVR
jgi:hypothetical protein